MTRLPKLTIEQSSALARHMFRKEHEYTPSEAQVTHILSMARLKENGEVVLKSSCKKCVEVNTPIVEGFKWEENA